MQQGYYRYEHKYLSRGGNKTRGASGATHLRAAANYYANSNKCPEILHVNLSSDRVVLDDMLKRHDRSVTRANGRIAETPQFCFDNRMSYEHMQLATRRFLWRVTFHGQIKAAAFIHTNDPGNMHAHAIILDRGNDGEAVGHFGRSGSYRRLHSEVKGNPVEWFRRVWEEECNGVLDEYGYDFRIDRRTNLERGLAPPGEHRGYSNDNEPVEPLPDLVKPELPEVIERPEQILETVEELPPDAPTSEVEPEEPGEDFAEIDSAEEELMKRISYGRRLEKAERLEKAKDTIQEMHVLKRKRADIEKARSEYVHWRNEAEQARDIASSLSDQLAEARQAKAMADEAMSATHYGSLRKGVRISLLGFEYKSKGYRRAEQAEIAHTNASYKEGMTASAFKEADQYAQRAVKNLAEYERKVEGLERQLERAMRVYGTAEDFDDAAQYLKEVFDDLTENMTPEDVIGAVDEGYITMHDAREFLETMGHTEFVDALDESEDAGVKH